MKSANEDNSYSHIVKYTGLFGGVQGLNILIGILRNKLVATILGPSGMGLISLFNSTINLLSNTTNLGIGMSAVRNISEIYSCDDTTKVLHTVKVVRSWSLLTAFAGMLLCVVLSPLLSYWTFGWGNHTLHFVLLSPIVALTAITGGEMAILKGARQLKKLAVASVYTVLAALITSVPIYFFFGEAGIVPSLIIMAICQMLFIVVYSYRLFPLQISINRNLLSEGMSMVKIGVAFVFAGILGSGAEFAIRSYLSYSSSLETLGLFSAGYMMTMTYSGLVFAAMETDYFPRLSSVNDNVEKRNLLVNRQMEVSLLLVSPILVAFMIGLPIIIPLLYTSHFMPVEGMMQVMILAMFMRAVKLPMAYLPLAHGDSVVYLTVEAIYDVVVVLLVVFGFKLWGLTGCGVAITIAGAIDFLVIILCSRIKYDFTFSREIIYYMLLFFPLACVAFLITFINNLLCYWGCGIVLIAITTMLSYSILKRNKVDLSHIFQRFKRK